MSSRCRGAAHQTLGNLCTHRLECMRVDDINRRHCRRTVYLACYHFMVIKMAGNPKATMKCGEVRKSTLPHKKVMKLYCLPGGKRRLVRWHAVVRFISRSMLLNPKARGRTCRCTPAIAGTNTTTRTRREETFVRGCGVIPPSPARADTWRVPSCGAKSQSSTACLLHCASKVAADCGLD